jgi:hypothetical protein
MYAPVIAALKNTNTASVASMSKLPTMPFLKTAVEASSPRRDAQGADQSIDLIATAGLTRGRTCSARAGAEADSGQEAEIG